MKSDEPAIKFHGDYNTGFFMSRLDWVDNGDRTFSAIEQFQNPSAKEKPRASRIMETISEADYFLLVLEGKDRDRLQMLYLETDNKEEK